MRHVVAATFVLLVASSAHAVPAISMCTQGASPANSLMKSAPVMAPPARPPVFVKSAISLYNSLCGGKDAADGVPAP